MTEYWVSQAKFWCELCKCWLTDTPTARANHEKGTGHKLNVQRKLRELRKNAETEKKEKERNDTELEKIDKAAEKAYKKDLEKQEAEAAPLPPPAQPPPQLGQWLKNSQSKYLYNAELKWYYDENTGFYYGGEPPEWTASPAVPEAAKYKGQKKAVTVVKGKLPDHIANLGGYKAPISGELTRGVFGNKSADTASNKRTRETVASAAKNSTEAEEIRKREEARERVKKRTASSFGLQ